ncbi:hypothetical protein BCR41DRAFT_346364 [Lobosporangium transversale]|uniref:Uncharacterized protein n=1 Tax=Lobosporangium transversale TaxID=64571 RepID=A0A1Y2H0F2_9FUNG|nr:hypothetical protein BCR41DRAFT_346364 [Lobosporangium transversale]ORZ27995.1 hypothetical protein BCR41DRAFT_346364 [Lobosporangium transversale]|eukprot:XP_021885698.1 hypothetical protein BCR41DRAFT_346364 [Lobosporangium transversale]
MSYSSPAVHFAIYLFPLFTTSICLPVTHSHLLTFYGAVCSQGYLTLFSLVNLVDTLCPAFSCLCLSFCPLSEDIPIF